MDKNILTNRFCGIAVCAFMLFATQVFAAWDGSISEKAPSTAEENGETFYLIENESQLAWFANETNKGGKLDINAKLAADLDMNHKLWTPMAAGKGDVAFAGIIDGDNHIISNLYINSDEIAQINPTYAQNLGFVGVLGNGLVKNIFFENVDIVTSTNAGSIVTNKTSQISVGAVVGWLADKTPGGVVSTCYVSGNITATGNGQGVGGIVGNAKNGTIENCMSAVSISATGNDAFIGGIVGITKASLTLSACVYNGEGLSNAGNGSTGVVVGNHMSGMLTYRYGAVAIKEYTDKTVAEIDGEYSGRDTVKITEDIHVDEVVFNRKFIKGTMSTIMLPFSIDTSMVKGGKIYRFKRVDVVDDIWKVKIGRIYTEQVAANTPYMVMPMDDRLTFKGAVTFNTETKPVENLNDGNWEFRGTNAYKVFGDDPELGKIYGFAGQERDGAKVGQFVQAGAEAYIVPLRAYLINHQSSALAKTLGNSLNNTSFSVPNELHVEIVDENDNVVQSGRLNTVTGEFRLDSWFDLNGRKLNAKPTVQGTYYHNGKRVIVK